MVTGVMQIPIGLDGAVDVVRSIRLAGEPELGPTSRKPHYLPPFRPHASHMLKSGLCDADVARYR